MEESGVKLDCNFLQSVVSRNHCNIMDSTLSINLEEDTVKSTNKDVFRNVKQQLKVLYLTKEDKRISDIDNRHFSNGNVKIQFSGNAVKFQLVIN